MRAGTLERQTGTSAPSAKAASCRSDFSPHKSANRRSAAAASAEPPPIPEATGKFFSSANAAPTAASILPATLGGNTVIKYAASKNPQFVADFVLQDTKAHWAAPFRKDSVALRNQMQDALDCMKQDGTIAKLSEKWFGSTPAPDDLERVVTPGYGVPGMPGYDPTPHPMHCG